MSTTSPVTVLPAAASSFSLPCTWARARGEKTRAAVRVAATAIFKTVGLFLVELNMREISAVQCDGRSEEHTSELQSLTNLVCRLLLEKKNIKIQNQLNI